MVQQEQQYKKYRLWQFLMLKWMTLY